MELFIFDTFPLAQQISLMELPRECEFTPVNKTPSSAGSLYWPICLPVALPDMGVLWASCRDRHWSVHLDTSLYFLVSDFVSVWT